MHLRRDIGIGMVHRWVFGSHWSRNSDILQVLLGVGSHYIMGIGLVTIYSPWDFWGPLLYDGTGIGLWGLGWSDLSFMGMAWLNPVHGRMPLILAGIGYICAMRHQAYMEDAIRKAGGARLSKVEVFRLRCDGLDMLDM